MPPALADAGCLNPANNGHSIKGFVVFQRSIIAAFTFFDLDLFASMKVSMEGGFSIT
ncbi:hypothetical protein [Synechococcus sp. UW140]|uniref:hypothetical protein n=1 Tax=Synechococcus sp. UW140 TaxID=368503 RepID=UPI003137A5AE